MNRVMEEGGENFQQPTAGDYFLVVGEFCTWYISTEMARHIERCLDARKPSHWVKFVDLTGARVRLRIRQIESIIQCSAEQRANEREFFRALKRERKSDRDWDSDD
jgi:hypothetical protein